MSQDPERERPGRVKPGGRRLPQDREHHPEKRRAGVRPGPFSRPHASAHVTLLHRQGEGDKNLVLGRVASVLWRTRRRPGGGAKPGGEWRSGWSGVKPKLARGWCRGRRTGRAVGKGRHAASPDGRHHSVRSGWVAISCLTDIAAYVALPSHARDPADFSLSRQNSSL